MTEDAAAVLQRIRKQDCQRQARYAERQTENDKQRIMLWVDSKAVRRLDRYRKHHHLSSRGEALAAVLNELAQQTTPSTKPKASKGR